jgi:aspartyl-tRNA(Asn)/glutamyl-tRNA(Gln) amidotransferase subunit C
MRISKKEIQHVADLARIDLESEDIEKFADQIGKILQYVETLNEVDTQGVSATTHALSLNNAFREDEPQGHLERDLALSNSPEKEEGQFVVPKIVG